LSAGIDPDHVVEMFADFGPVLVRRMFGGAGIYRDGLMFGLVSGGLIYLKADAESVPAFEREGSKPFEYVTKRGRRGVMSYWRLPERLYDDPADLAHWSRQAFSAAQRAARERPGKPAARKKRRG
jgi:DNA transformation protein